MTLLSLIPVVGAGVVWAPVAGYLLLTGDYVSGVVLLAYGSSSSVWRTTSSAPSWWGAIPSCRTSWSCFSTLGGFSLFGMDGFVTGPMLAVLFVTVWKIFMDEFKPPLTLDGSAPAQDADGDGPAA